MVNSDDYDDSDDERGRGKRKGKRGLPAFLQKLATCVEHRHGPF